MYDNILKFLIYLLLIIIKLALNNQTSFILRKLIHYYRVLINKLMN